MSSINDIARVTGLSLGTISKYLNGHKVKEANKQLIEKAINDLNYQVNIAARSLRTHLSYNIGIVVPNIDFKFFTDLISQIENNLSNVGFFISLLVLDSNQNQNIQKLSSFLNNHIDGLIVILQNEDATLDYIMNHAQMPIVLVDNYSFKYHNHSQVLIDNYDSAYSAVLSQKNSFHKQMGIISGSKNIVTAKERLKGVINACNQLDIAYNIAYGDYTSKSGYLACKQLFKQSDDYDCLFIANYDMGIGAITYLKQYYPNKLDDLQLIVFDSRYLLDLLAKKVIAIEQPIDEMAKYISEHILALINKECDSQLKYFKCLVSGGGCYEKTRNIK